MVLVAPVKKCWCIPEAAFDGCCRTPENGATPEDVAAHVQPSPLSPPPVAPAGSASSNQVRSWVSGTSVGVVVGEEVMLDESPWALLACTRYVKAVCPVSHLSV